jgi:hypothetical protein
VQPSLRAWTALAATAPDAGEALVAVLDPPERKRRMTMDLVELRKKLAKWMFFEVVFALLPLLFSLASALVHKQGWDFYGALGRGELVLVAAAIIAASVGDLVKNGLAGPLPGTKLSLIGTGMALVAAAGWFYSEAAPTAGRSELEIAVIVSVSALIGTAAFFLSLFCLVVAEVR